MSPPLDLNALAESSGLAGAVSAVIPFTRISRGRPASSVDGVHYERDVNMVAAQMLFKYVDYQLSPSDRVRFIDNSSRPEKGKGGGVAQSIPYGVAVLWVVVSMLMSFDNYGFISWLAYRIFAGNLPSCLWLTSTRELHRSIGISAKELPRVAIDPKEKDKSSDNGNVEDEDVDERAPLVKSKEEFIA